MFRRILILILAVCLCAAFLPGCLARPAAEEPAETEILLSELPAVSPTYLILQKGANALTYRTHDPEMISRITEAFCGKELSPVENGPVLDRATVYHVIMVHPEGQILLDIDARGYCRVDKSPTVYLLIDTESLYLAVQALFLSLSK